MTEPMNSSSAAGVDTALMVMEAGFKIIAGKETEFLAMQAKMVPLGASQPGFVAVYGGPILDSDWLYFGVRFASESDMELWQQHPQHQQVQKLAYEQWWTAVYIRKWRTPVAGADLGPRLMCETRLTVPTPLNADQIAVVRERLTSLGEAGAARFETLAGTFENQPYQFVGPLEIAPPANGTVYSLITHWTRVADLNAWQDSAAYRQLQRLGALHSETFVAAPERGQRRNLRADKLQRQWVTA